MDTCNDIQLIRSLKQAYLEGFLVYFEFKDFLFSLQLDRCDHYEIEKSCINILQKLSAVTGTHIFITVMKAFKQKASCLILTVREKVENGSVRLNLFFFFFELEETLITYYIWICVIWPFERKTGHGNLWDTCCNSYSTNSFTEFFSLTFRWVSFQTGEADSISESPASLHAFSLSFICLSLSLSVFSLSASDMILKSKQGFFPRW